MLGPYLLPYLLMTFYTLLEVMCICLLTTSDIQILQDDIHKLFECSVTWSLKFSQSKCCYFQVGPPSRSCHHCYMLNSTMITLTYKQKDLGIWIDPNLSSCSHIYYTVSRPNRILDLISKCFQYLDSNMLLSLYKTTVHSVVELY